MNDGFIKVAAATADTNLNDIAANVKSIVSKAEKADKRGAKIVCFQELALTGYTMQDMFFQRTVLDKAIDGLKEIAEQTKDLDIVSIVGLPFSFKEKIYDAAAVIQHGQVLGIATKRYLPNYDEFYDGRYFTPSFADNEKTSLFGKDVPIGPKLLFSCTQDKDLVFGIEICEDLWVPDTPSTHMALNGATLIFNPSASNEIVGKAKYRHDLVSMTSARLIAGYVYVGTGFGESTGDVVYSGHSIIAENGSILAEINDFNNNEIYSDVDVSLLSFRRSKMTTYPYEQDKSYLTIPFSFNKIGQVELDRKFTKSPYLDKAPATLSNDLTTIFEAQVHGLMRRVVATKSKSLIIGVSGGLDSALALLVSHRAFSELGYDVNDIHAFSMPAFATTSRTRNNSKTLCTALGVTFKEVDITNTVESHLKDLGHSDKVYDAAYENAQARARTYLLMDSANMFHGLVVGTGDLSEIALGWSTYNGDQMSMYNVNASVPKTVVKEVVRFVANKYTKTNPVISKTLLDILATPISPELVPDKDRNHIGQVTEDIIGPYELHDFFLYCFLRRGYKPTKIIRIAKLAFAGEYDEKTIAKWLVVFYRRFFASQFKRSAAPDGVKVGSVSLSQRGDLRMPSDLGNIDFISQIDSTGPKKK